MNVRRPFLLLVTLAAVAATPAFGQAVPPAAGPVDGGVQNAASIPDFSGIWSHPYLTGFEIPFSGPGPVLNRSRSPNGVANFQQLVGDYANPILQPWAADVVKKHGEMSLAGLGYPTPSNQCWPGGVPYVFWDFLVQMVQEHGDSVGHYDGDMLVIDNVGIKIGPFAMVDMYGMPHTEALHVLERYRLIDYDAAKEAIARNDRENFRVRQDSFDPGYRGKVLQLQFTVEDPGVFTRPWSSMITYRRAFGEWTDLICSENTHEYFADRDSEVPTADKPNF